MPSLPPPTYVLLVCWTDLAWTTIGPSRLLLPPRGREADEEAPVAEGLLAGSADTERARDKAAAAVSAGVRWTILFCSVGEERCTVRGLFYYSKSCQLENWVLLDNAGQLTVRSEPAEMY